MPRKVRISLICLAILGAYLFGLYSGGHYYRASWMMGAIPQAARSFFFPGSDTVQLEREIEGILQEN